MVRKAVLIAGETSGRVRDAFLRRGHYAVSCDFLPTKVKGPHIVGNAFDLLDYGWDTLIAHPTCTFLTVAAAWCYYHPEDKHLPMELRRPHPRWPDRHEKQDAAAADFMRFMEAPIPEICVENPVGVMSSRYRQPDQIVQPYEFGDDASKKTCLWLKGLKPLRIDPAKRVPGRIVVRGGEAI